jgi:hypothetical protein
MIWMVGWLYHRKMEIFFKIRVPLVALWLLCDEIIDQRSVDVLCDHDQKVPTKDFVRPSQHNDKKPLRACSDTLSCAITRL